MQTKNHSGFSLTEILVTMLVVTLLLAAMAPVMTKKYREALTIKGRSNYAILSYGDVHCPAVPNDVLDEGNASCSGNFLVPDGVTELTVTVVGAGGGGGAGNASGYAEYTTPGTSSFTVPYGSTDINTTLISGGAGGGAGGVVETYTEWLASNSDTTQDRTWTIPNQVKGRNVIIEACGAGGGGGGSGACNACYVAHYGGGGGAGEYLKRTVSMGASNSTLYLLLGGGGAGGGSRGSEGYAGGGLCGGGSGIGYWGGTASGLEGALNLRRGCGDGADNGGNAAGVGAKGGSAPRNGGNGGTYCGGGGGAGPLMNGAISDSSDLDSGIIRYPGGAGGGGGSTVMAFSPDLASPILHLVGGGGGSSGSLGNGNPATVSYARLIGGGGGGGGGPSTGNKGAGASILSPNDYFGRRGYSGDGSGGDGGNGTLAYNGLTVSQKPSTWGNNCDGGAGGYNHTTAGKPGAARVTYLDYGSGGSGGGGAAVVARSPMVVTPNETFTLSIAQGGKGGTAGYIDSSGAIVQPTNGSWGPESILYRGSDILLRTNTNAGQAAREGNSRGYCYGGAGPYACIAGWLPASGGGGGQKTSGFSNGGGKTAGNSTTLEVITYPDGTIGGDGGPVSTPWFACTPGSGGTLSSPDGGNGQGYGCGGGGGYGLADGGDGGDGYARLEYNPANIGSGGGGGAGLSIKKIKMSVTSREVIPYTIGAGGMGGKIVGTTPTPSKQGGTTTFNTGSRLIQTGGGFGGGNVSVSSNTIINGAAGVNASICTVVGTTSTLCKTGANLATSGSNSKGGNGADSLDTKGAIGGDVNEDLTLKKAGAGSGGAGASVYTNQATQSPKHLQGGQGGHGVIIVEWR